MTRSEIINIANNAIAEEFELELDVMVPEAQLYQELGFDSLDAVDLVLVLERSFGVKLRNNEEVKEVRTLGDIYDLIEKLQ
ncbi:MAG: acyl carrier protein [Desulfotalea sp.]